MRNRQQRERKDRYNIISSNLIKFNIYRITIHYIYTVPAAHMKCKKKWDGYIYLTKLLKIEQSNGKKFEEKCANQLLKCVLRKIFNDWFLCNWI